MAAVSMREMLEAGVHFGHQSRYWNPQMAPYLFGVRNKIYIIDLEQTLPLFNDAINYLGQMAANKNTILFVGTKKAAGKTIAEQAQRCGMPYVGHRWLGGMLTNFKTIKKSINRLKELENMHTDGSIQRFGKKEALGMQREMTKLNRSLGGIKNMNGIPDVLFVLDVGFEKNAVNEAKKLGIPIVGIVDSNNSPNNIDYVVPGNDDSIRAIKLYCESIATAIIEAKEAAIAISRAEDAKEKAVAEDRANSKGKLTVKATDDQKTAKPASKIQKAIKSKKAANEAAAKPATKKAAKVADDSETKIKPVADKDKAKPVSKAKRTATEEKAEVAPVKVKEKSEAPAKAKTEEKAEAPAKAKEKAEAAPTKAKEKAKVAPAKAKAEKKAEVAPKAKAEVKIEAEGETKAEVADK